MATNVLTWAYDDAGRMILSGDANVAYSYDYDSLDRSTSMVRTDSDLSDNLYSSSTTYDENGLPKNRVVNSLSSQLRTTDYFAFDRLNRPTELRHVTTGDSADLRVFYEYDDIGNRHKTTRKQRDGSGSYDTVAITEYAQDAAIRLREIKHRAGSTTLATYGYEYDAASRIVEWTDPIQSRKFEYDNAGQLIGVDKLNSNGSSHVDSEDYVYSPNGNRDSSTVEGASSSYLVGPNNQLTSDGNYTYEYDNEGNRTRRTRIADTSEYTVYTWDHRNRLIGVSSTESGGPSTVEFEYDVNDLVIKKKVDVNGDGALDRGERYVYQDNELFMVFDELSLQSGVLSEESLTARFVHGFGVDEVLAERHYVAAVGRPSGQSWADSELVLWALTDHLGSVTQLAEYDSNLDTVSIVKELAYDGFGNVVHDSDDSVENRFGYTGRVFDADIGLNYHRARWFDNQTGHWISQDPIGFAAGDTNLQRYVGNSPTGFVDPSGFEASVVRPFELSDLTSAIPFIEGGEIPIDPQPNQDPPIVEVVEVGGVGRKISRDFFQAGADSTFDPTTAANYAFWGSLYDSLVLPFIDIEPSHRIRYSDGSGEYRLSGGPTGEQLMNVGTLGTFKMASALKAGALNRAARTRVGRTRPRGGPLDTKVGNGANSSRSFDARPRTPPPAQPKPPAPKTGGRKGSATTRAQNQSIADRAEAAGQGTHTAGADLPERYYPNPAG
ncbi:MAG: RHS repeat-associated core domain-containing protein, partial [Planctomycetota bacterium]